MNKVKLGDCIELIIDNRGKTPPLAETGYELIETASINGSNKYPDYSKITKFVSEETYNTWFRKGHPTSGDILISTVGMNIGDVVIMKSNRGSIAQNLIALRTNNKLNSDYLYYILSSKNIREKIRSLNIGSAQPSLKVPHLLNIEFYLPNIEKQSEISKILNELDEKIEINTQINQTLEQIAQTIFKSWFIDFDPVHAKANAVASGQTAEQAIQAAMAVISGKNTQELHRLQTANPEQYQQLWEIADAFPSGVDEEGVPWGWESKKVGEVAKIVKGKKPKLISSEPDDGFLPHILMASLSGKYTEYAQIDKSIVCDIFDTLILMDGAASGKIAIGHKGVIGSTFAKMELSENKYWALFNLFMFSKEQDIQANTTGTSIPHTDKARVLDYEIIVPCDVVLNYFTEMYKNILCSILNQRKNSFILENIRDLLLPKLLSGEILNGN